MNNPTDAPLPSWLGKDTPQLRARLRNYLAAAALRDQTDKTALRLPLSVESVKNSGSYGDGDNDRTGFNSFELRDDTGKIIADTLNSDDAEVLEEAGDDEMPSSAWDENGRLRMEEIAKRVNAFDGLVSDIETQRAEIKRLMGVIERDRTEVARILGLLRQAIGSRRWMVESRGSFEYDDATYQREFGVALEEIESSVTNRLALLAADLRDSPSTHDDIFEARRLSALGGGTPSGVAMAMVTAIQWIADSGSAGAALANMLRVSLLADNGRAPPATIAILAEVLKVPLDPLSMPKVTQISELTHPAIEEASNLILLARARQ